MNLNATLIAQIVVFLALWWFTARFVWPPITRALDARAQRIADGLAAADKAKADLVAAERRVEQELQQARAGASEVRAVAERQAAGVVEGARTEAAQIVAAARKAAEDHMSYVENQLSDLRRAERNEEIARLRYQHELARD